jgi:hypothetical protein
MGPRELPADTGRAAKYLCFLEETFHQTKTGRRTFQLNERQ